MLKDSLSTEETAQYMVRWAIELFGEWATWMTFVLPGWTLQYQKSTLDIVNAINIMYENNKIDNLEDGWKNLTDLLRASYTCRTPRRLYDALSALHKNDRVKLLSVKPRFGIAHEYLNDVLVTFEYNSKMICQVTLKLVKSEGHFLSHSNSFLHEIGRACESKDRFRLLEAYNKAIIYPAENN